jgi:hypothetical protein
MKWTWRRHQNQKSSALIQLLKLGDEYKRRILAEKIKIGVDRSNCLLPGQTQESD